jgi:hypothetical protein
VQINPSSGSFTGAPANRAYRIVYHGLSASEQLYYNGTAIPSYASSSSIPANQNGTVWDATGRLLTAYLSYKPVTITVRVSNSSTSIIMYSDAANHIRNAVRIVKDEIVVEKSVGGDLRLSIHQLNGRLVRPLDQPTMSTRTVQIYSLRPLKLSKGVYVLMAANADITLVQNFLIW